ncbi:hypothetical protein [Klebsiella oxytoca]|uniref:hypothetical protein n=1 Tax=Klebsiella oxytoca TaxID=571 RepID=UPI0013A54982
MNILFAFDCAHIWHPFTSITRLEPSYEVDSAQDVELRLGDGRTLVDGRQRGLQQYIIKEGEILNVTNLITFVVSEL